MTKKYENNKLKTPKELKINNRPKLLTTLGSSELSLEEINEAKKRYQERLQETNTSLKEEELSMTREIKYKNLFSFNFSIKQFFKVNDLALSLQNILILLIFLFIYFILDLFL